MYKIAVIGTGNMAWHLVPALKRLGHEVVAVSRHTSRSAKWPVAVLSHEELSRFKPQIAFLAVPDGRIADCSKALSHILLDNVVMIHTSGATAMKRIDGYFKNRGVVWPIRSFLKGSRTTLWREIPIAYQGNNAGTLGLVKSIVDSLSWTSYELDSQQRAQLHLAAVYSNNFVSWMYQISYELCAEKDVPFSALLPIMRNTAGRQKGAEPKQFQTGAAARDDRETMERHLKKLNGHPEFARLYRLMSHLIQEGLQD